MINLVKNALKFTERGFIKVSMAYNETSKTLILHIRDTGRGIERSDLSKLFQRFGKLEQEDKSVNKEGVGLGLTICEAIVAQYEGLIEVQSLGPGEGTLFIFSMRMEIAEDPVDEHFASEPPTPFLPNGYQESQDSDRLGSAAHAEIVEEEKI